MTAAIWLLSVLIFLPVVASVASSLYLRKSLRLKKDAENKYAFDLFGYTLVTTGILIFSRDLWPWWSDEIDMLGTSKLEYYGFLGAVSTIFALLISFEISRLEQRMLREGEFSFSLFGRLKSLLGNENLTKKINKLGKVKKSKEIEATNIKLFSELEKELCKLGKEDVYSLENSTDRENEYIKYVNETIAELMALAYSMSRNRGIASGYVFTIFGFFMITLAIGLRPASVEGLTGVFVDASALVLSVTIAYFTAHLALLRLNRRDSIFGYMGYEYGKIKKEKTKWDKLGERLDKSSHAATLLLVVYIIAGYCIKWLVVKDPF